MGEPVVDYSLREMVRGEKKIYKLPPGVAIKVFQITFSDEVLNSVFGTRDPRGVQGTSFITSNPPGG